MMRMMSTGHSSSTAEPIPPSCCCRNRSTGMFGMSMVEDTRPCFKRTLGMGSWPLNRRRTRLSIPFGFLHASFTLL